MNTVTQTTAKQMSAHKLTKNPVLNRTGLGIRLCPRFHTAPGKPLHRQTSLRLMSSNPPDNNGRYVTWEKFSDMNTQHLNAISALHREITKYQCTFAAANNNSANNVESRVHDALKMLEDRIAKVDTKTAEQIQNVGAQLSGEMKNIAAALGNEIKNVSNQFGDMETLLTSIAKNTRPKLGGKMKVVGEVIIKKLTPLGHFLRLLWQVNSPVIMGLTLGAVIYIGIPAALSYLEQKQENNNQVVGTAP